MTASVHVTIFCDGEDCLEWTSGDQPRARESRQDAKAEGWMVGLPGGRDLCPKCKDTERGY